MSDKPAIIWSTQCASLDSLSSGIEHVIQQGCQGILLLTGIDNNYPEKPLNEILGACSVPIGGGMFSPDPH